MSTATAPKGLRRPVEKYELGVHHMAQPTCDPKATIEFYCDVMGATITHCVASRGWRPKHFDYIHMFLDLGKGDNIAMFYYFGAKSPEDWPRYGTHHSFAANTLEELDQWAQWLEANGYEIVQRNTYEVMSSIYVWDPNGRFLEIACNHRPLNAIDAEDGQLTAEALKLAAAEGADSVTRMWQIKAQMLEERENRTIEGPALIIPNLDEFAWAKEQVDSSEPLGDNFTILYGSAFTKPDDLPESLWWSSGTGGIKGTVETFDETTLTIT